MFNKKNRIYIFDWDDNIMIMPTSIIVEKLVDGKWVEDTVSTEVWSSARNSDKYRPSTLVDDPFIHFENDEDFIKDLNQAILYENFGPSFYKFKEALIYGNDFAIITARGHSKEGMIAGIMFLINHTFTLKEYIQFMNNVGNIATYLNKQDYWTVSSKHFEEYFDGVTDDHPTEARKKIALEYYVDKKIKNAEEIDVMAKLSIGFSDDDKKNINTVKNLKKRLKKSNPDVHFVVYDTSNPKNIEKTPIYLK